MWKVAAHISTIFLIQPPQYFCNPLFQFFCFSDHMRSLILSPVHLSFAIHFRNGRHILSDLAARFVLLWQCRRKSVECELSICCLLVYPSVFQYMQKNFSNLILQNLIYIISVNNYLLYWFYFYIHIFRPPYTVYSTIEISSCHYSRIIWNHQYSDNL